MTISDIQNAVNSDLRPEDRLWFVPSITILLLPIMPFNKLVLSVPRAEWPSPIVKWFITKRDNFVEINLILADV